MSPTLNRRGVLGLVIVGQVLLAQLPARAAEVTGRVVGVIDGDTIDVLTSKLETLRVRMSGIDAPELGQAFGRNAKAALSGLAFTRQVTIEWHKRDRYGRLVGKVTVEGRDIALEMLTLGMAWHYARFESEQPAADRRGYADAQTRARVARRGLWADAAPVPPWEHRARRSDGKGK
jgi:endonuclease YncB( thermonuclease family)